MSQYSERLVAGLLHLRQADRLALIGCIAICGCTSPLLAPEDRDRVCHVAVNEKFGSIMFQPNPLSNAAGGLVGAGTGAFAGLVYGSAGGLLGAIIGVPVGTVVGAVGGAACGAASISRPNAEADFEKILKTADARNLKRALETDLNAPRTGCIPAQQDDYAAAPDTVIEIENLEVMMGCAFEEQKYWLAVRWRALNAATQKSLLLRSMMTCTVTSRRGVDEWLADPEQSRLEIERVLTKIGQRMAADLLSSRGPSECKLRSTKTGDIEER